MNEYNNYRSMTDMVNANLSIDEIKSDRYKTMSELEKETGVVPKISRMYADIALTMDEKLKVVKENMLEKASNIDGYSDVELLSLTDADSGKLRLPNGDIIDFRLSSGSFNYYDAADSKAVLDNTFNNYKKSNVARARQYATVARLTGKSTEELTDEDFNNVKRYQLQETVNSLRDSNYQFQPYDRNRIYEPINGTMGIRLKAKISGNDTTGNRALIDIINPNTGRSLGFDTASNPYLNTRFDLYDWIDTPKNQKRLEAYEHQHESMLDRIAREQALYDTDGRISEDIDLIKSAAYQMAARVLQRIPGADKEYWSQVADADTGQKWADLVAGVSKKTRDNFAANNEKVSNLIEQGDYTGAAIEAFTNVDRYLAESAPQMGLMIAGGIVTKGLTIAGKAMQTLVAALPAGIDKALTDVEEFKKNNGRSMTPTEFARTLAITTATLVPEQLLLGMFGGKAKDLLTQAIGKTLGKTTTSATATTGKIIADFAKTTGIATATEAGQEALETATDNWLSENQSKHTNLIDDAIRHISSTDVKAAALIGGIMGGTLSAAGGSLATPVNIKTNAQRKAIANALIKHDTEKTLTGQDADVDVSTAVINTVNSLPTRSTDDEKIQAIKDLYQQSLDISLSEKAVNAIQRKQKELATALVHSLSKLEKEEDRKKAQDAFFKAMNDAGISSLGTREGLFGQLVYHSNYNAGALFREGKVASSEAREQAKEELLEIADQIGLDRKTAIKTLEDVNQDVKYGPRGYYSYKDRLTALNDKMRGNPNLSEADRIDIQKEIANTTLNIVSLVANQQNKLVDLVSGVEEIASGKKRKVDVQYRSGDGKFTIVGSHIANNRIESNTGVYGLINSLKNDIKEMSATLSDTNLVPSDRLQDIAATYNSRENNKVPQRSRKFYNEDITTNLLSRFRNAVTTIQSKVKEDFSKPKEGILGKFSNRGKQLTPANAAAMLDRLVRGANESATTNLTQSIRNYLDYGNVDDLKKAIDSYYSKSKDKRDKALAKLDEIQKLDETNKNEVSNRENTSKKIKEEITEDLNKVDSNFLKNFTLDDVREVNSVVSNIHKLRSKLKEVITDSTEDKALLNRLNEIETGIQQRIAELRKTEEDKFSTTPMDGKRPAYSHAVAPKNSNGAIAATKANNEVVIYTDERNRPILKTVSDFIDYISGKHNTPTSEQKQKVFAILAEKGFDEKFFRNNLKTVNDIYDLILFHEKSHIRHNDRSCYYDKGKDLLTEDKIAIEARATEEAIGEFLLMKKQASSKPTTATTNENQANTSDLTSNPSQEVSSEKSVTSTTPTEKTEATKDSPVRSLLDGKTNNSVNLYQNKEKRIDLNRELRVGNADSKLAIDPTIYDDEFDNANYGLSMSPRQIFEKMKFSFKGLVRDKIAAYSHFYKAYHDTPQMLLLYNIATGTVGESKLGTIESINYNDIVCKGIDFSTKEYFVSRLYKNLFKPDTLPDERVCAMFGYNEATITPKELRQLKQFIKEYGVPRAYMADMLGLNILRNLGIRPNTETGNWGFYERIATGLGLEALRYAEELGLLTNNTYEAKEDNGYKAVNAKHVICVQINERNQAIINKIASRFNSKQNSTTGEKVVGLIESMKPDETTRLDKDIKWNKPSTLRDKVYVRNTDDLIEVPPKAKEILQKLHNQEYAINHGLVDVLRQNREAVEKKLGWKAKEEIEDLYFSRQSGQEATNQSITEQLDAIFATTDEYNRRRHLVGKGAINKGEGGIYFDWYMSRNGRFFIDSSGVNPQTQKFQRFLLMPSKVYRDFDPNNEEHAQLEAFAIVQAFDNVKHSNEDIAKIAEKVNALSLEELEQVQKDLLDVNMSEDAFGAKYKDIGLKGVENLAQCLNVLQHLKAKKQANGKVFKTWLAVENDSTTSGYAIRFANMPLESQFKMMAKTGILVGDMLDKYADKQIHEMKANKEDFHDLYEDTAMDISQHIADLHPSKIGLVKKSFSAFLKKEKKVFNPATINGLAQIWADMYDALPRAKEDGTVTGALRTLMKSPTMVFGYGGGIKGISENMSYEIMDDFVQTYVEVKRAGSVDNFIKKNPDADKAKVKAIVKTLDGIGSNFINSKGENITFTQALMTRDIDRIRVRIGATAMSIEELFYNIIRPTYGSAVDQALDEKFKEYKHINDLMSQAFITMFDLFNSTLEANTDTELSKNGSITITARKKLVEALRTIWPSIPTPYGLTDKDGTMLLMKSRKMPYNSKHGINKVQNYYLDKTTGKFRTETAYANMRVFDNTSRAGAVVPIHWLDGSIMAMVLAKHIDEGITPIHDAWVMSALAAGDITRTANETILRINAQYDLLGTIQDRFFNVIKEHLGVTDEISNIDDLLSSTDDKIRDFLDNTVIKDNKGRAKEAIDEMTGEKYAVTLRGFIADLYENWQTVKKARDLFYSQMVGITNVDGSPNTEVVINTPDTNEIGAKSVVESAISEWDTKQGSSYRGYQTDGSIKETMERIVTDVNARADFLEDIDNMCRVDGGMTCTTSHLSRLKDIIIKLNPKELKNIVVELAKDGKLFRNSYNAGELDTKNSEKFVVRLAADNFSDIDSVTRQSVYSSMSMAEIYAHEVVHAGLHFAFTQHLNSTVKFNSEIHQLLNLQRAAMEVITPMDFMPDNYDKSLEDVYRKHAEATWNYIFDNDNKNSLEGLREFCAYGLTSEKLVEKLKTIKVPEKNTTFKNAADRLLHIVKGIFDLIFGNKSLKDVFPLANSIMKGNTGFKNNSIYQDLEQLAYRMSNADARAAKNLTSQLSKPFEWVCQATSTVAQFGNRYLGGAIAKVSTLADNKEWNRLTEYAEKIGDSRWDDAKTIASSLGLILVSAQRRRVLKQWLVDVTKMSQQSAIMSVLNDITEPDFQSMRLEMLSMYYRTADTSAKALEAVSYNEMVKAFGRKLNTLEETSLTRAALMTDLQCLLDDNTSISDVVKLVTDDKAREAELTRIRGELISNPDYEWLNNQALGLAVFMVEGIGNEAQNLNSHNIAKGLLSGKKVNVSEKERVLIDKLATLYAVDLVDTDYRTVFGSLKPEGLQSFLTTHKQFVNETNNGLMTNNGSMAQVLDPLHVIKGYTKSLFDTSYDIAVGSISDSSDFKDRGYTLVKKLPVNRITGTEGLAIYRRSWANPNRRDGASTRLVGAHAMGTTLKDSAYSLAEKLCSKDMSLKPKDLWDVFYKNAYKREQKIARMMSKKALSVETIRKLSSGYTPTMSPTGVAHDYRITMSYDDKVNLLGMDTRGLTILSKMYATQELKATAPVINKALTGFLVTNMEQNMDKYHRDINTGMKYVKLERNSPNKYLRESWDMVPQEMKDAAEDLKDGLWIRDDWLLSLFGTQSYSITEALPEKSFTKTKRALSMAEYAMKAITFMVKRNIVLLIPKVFGGNLISNANYSIMTGSNPVKVFKTTLANFRAIRDYIDTAKELRRVEFRERIGIATAKESKSKNWLKTKLQSNRVHPLMEKGMYQAIVEDINPDELENIGKVMKFIKNWKIADKVPASMKWILKNLYMTEGTFIHDLMFTLTQYSDFVARATEYQLKLEAITKDTPKYLKDSKEINPVWKNKEEELSMMIVRAFINYDKPQSKGEQYLNDMGLMMFTKFAKRIQSIVTHQATKNPMGVLMFLASQSVFLDTEDIMEQNVFSKHWSALFHNPLYNFRDAVVPMPLQYWLGYKNLW